MVKASQSVDFLSEYIRSPREAAFHVIKHITERDQTLGEARHFRNHNYKDPGKLRNRSLTADLEEKESII